MFTLQQFIFLDPAESVLYSSDILSLTLAVVNYRLNSSLKVKKTFIIEQGKVIEYKK